MKRSLLIMTVLLLAGVFAAPSAQRRAEVALRAAMELETVKGDLRGAIEAYEKVVDGYPKDRNVQAQALLRMADCHRRLGDVQATAILQRIVREFPDQAEIASQARGALGGARANAGASARRVAVASGPETPNLSGILMGSVSRNGRFLCYTGGDGNVSELTVRELASGTDRVVVKGDRDSYPDQSSISSDGKQVAYVWWNNQADRYELRVIAVRDGAEPRVLVANAEIDWIEGLDWAPDDTTIAAQLHRADGTNAIGLVSVATGQLRVLESLDWRWTGRMFFSPDGRHIAYDFPQSASDRARDVFVLAVDGSSKTRVAPHGADDRAMGWSPDGSTVLFTSNRTGADALWGVSVASAGATPALLKRDFSSSVSKGITRAGSLFYGIPHVSGFELKVSAFDFNAARLTGAPRSVINQLIAVAGDFDWSPDGSTIVYVVRPRPMDDMLVFQDVSTGRTREVPVSLRGIGGPRFTPDGRHVIVRGIDDKAAPGLGLYRVDVAAGSTELLVGVSGPSQRSDISPDGARLYYRRFMPQGQMAFVERVVAIGTERMLAQRSNLGNLFLSPDGRYIATASRDVNAKSRAALVIPTNGGALREPMSAPESDQLSILMWAPDSRSFFVRRVSAGRHELLRVPLDGAPQQIDLDISQINGPVRVGPDGKSIAYAVRAVAKPAELWVLDNFLPVTKAAK
jgi:Tol biopolymer transport system component